MSETQSFSVDGAQSAGGYRLTFSNFNGASYTTEVFTLDTSGSAAGRAAAQLAVQAALQALPNNATGTVVVAAAGGGASAKNQLRISVTFSTKSGNIPAMALSAEAGAGRSYLFQPSQPVQTLLFPGPVVSGGAPNLRVQYKLFPTDTSLFPSIDSGSYWTSAVSASFTYQQSSVASAVTAITAALNSIPVISYAYPGYFVADSNVVGVLCSSCGPASAAGFSITVAFPDFLTGSIAVSTKVQLDTVTNFDVPSVTWLGAGYVALLGDNVDGNREAVTCSNRGICDFSTGLCSCFAGQTGEDCSQQNALARGSSSGGK